jgi:hypothetical protein
VQLLLVSASFFEKSSPIRASSSASTLMPAISMSRSTGDHAALHLLVERERLLLPQPRLKACHMRSVTSASSAA